MTDIETLHLQPRSTRGKGGARELRRQKRVPGIVYGQGFPPTPVSVEQAELVRQMKGPGFFARTFAADIEGQSVRVIARDVQRDPVKELPIHIDFLRFGARTQVSLDLDLVFENEDDCPGIRAGGVLTVNMHTITLVGRPDDLPEALKVDLSALDVGSVIHVKDLALPAGAEVGVDPETPVVSITAPSATPAEDDAAAADEDAGGESESESAPAEAADDGEA